VNRVPTPELHHGLTFEIDWLAGDKSRLG